MLPCRLYQSLRGLHISVACFGKPSREAIRHLQHVKRAFTTPSRHQQDTSSHSAHKLLETYKKSLTFASPSALKSQATSNNATRSLQQLPISDLLYDQVTGDQIVTLHGYLGHLRTPSKSLSFVEFFGPELLDSIQLVSVKKITGTEVHDSVRHSKAYSTVVITGKLKTKAAPTDAECQNDRIPNEIELHNLQFLNEFPSDIDSSAQFGADQRHLQLKTNKELRLALQLRSDLVKDVMVTLSEAGYQHIETPLLFKSTTEGAREFLVPTRRDGLAYALPQSPQQYKQLLIASGIPQYFQIARCFRDEDMRADRQPEFTQLDLERAFASGSDIMADVEALVKSLLASRSNSFQSSFDPSAPFNTMTYTEAMSKYGSDKPDLRLDYSISRIDYLLPVDLVSKISPLNQPAVDISVFRADQDLKQMQAFYTQFLDSPEAATYHNNAHGGPGIFIYDSKRPLSGLQAFGFEAAEEVERIFEPNEGDLILLQARPDEPLSGGSTALGRFMIDLNKAAVAQGLKTLPKRFDFLWVVDFPLFTPSSAEERGQAGSAGLQSTHHPFTSPKTAEDVDQLLSNPREVIADHYDLVLNGVEIGGGSRRIHNAGVQRLVMEQVLRMPADKVQEFDHLLEALRAGCPPHAGFALGLDRFIAVLLGKDSVRDVIAFPKWGRGDDPMVKAPAKVSAEEWDVYKLTPKKI